MEVAAVRNNVRRRVGSFAFALFFFFAVVVPLLGFAAGPAYADVDCLQCHEKLTKQKDVHPAVQMGCTACHTGIDASVVPHKKTNNVAKGLSAEPPDLCYGCHDKSKFTQKTIHPALSMGCTTCHNPHSSKNDKLLVAEPPDLCFNCHDKTMFTKKTVHPALAMGCTVCHNPHSSRSDKLLVAEVPELCFNCHDKKMFEGKDIHPPVMGGMCLSCHNPHSTDSEKLLVSEAPSLCFTCHDKKKFENKTTHPPVQAGMCLTCHFPHKSDNEKLLQSPVPDLCFNCHDKAKFTRKNVHPPVKAGKCLSCHNPHASKWDSLRLHTITVLCTSCHREREIRSGIHIMGNFQGVGHPVSGKKDPLRQGKIFSCVSCHQPHSSDFQKLLRYKGDLPFGICLNCHPK